ncbi:MAG: hypothetical protein HKO94_13260, partial [Flavobacteriaceae bacterium]|nr:hypothetical protein [Flavobacteriaceae bacterium]
AVNQFSIYICRLINGKGLFNLQNIIKGEDDNNGKNKQGYAKNPVTFKKAQKFQWGVLVRQFSECKNTTDLTEIVYF